MIPIDQTIIIHLLPILNNICPNNFWDCKGIIKKIVYIVSKTFWYGIRKVSSYYPRHIEKNKKYILKFL